MRQSKTLFAITLLISLTGCRSSIRPTEFTNPRFDFSFVERVAVLPLENLSGDRQAGVRATRLLVTELLATGAVDVVEPGEVRAAMERLSLRDTELTTDQITGLGESLGVQALLVGSVAQSESLRSGAVSIPVVTLDLRMLETETATSVWAATHTEKGAVLGAKLLGTGAEPISETTRRCVQEVLASLVG